MFSWPELYLISEWIIRIVMLVVVTQRRRRQNAMAWLVVIFFFPWGGFILYLFIGEIWLPRKRIRQHKTIVRYLQNLSSRFDDHPNMAHPELSAGLQLASKIAEQLGNMPILSGNRVEFFPENESLFDRIVEDIDAARHHVHLLFFIFADDATGKRISDAVARAARRGVTCRVLVDAQGSRIMLRALADRMRTAKVDVREMLPVSLLRRGFSRVDLRNHRKLVVIDGLVAYTGSHNVVDSSYGHKNLAWHDLSARITGPVVLELQAVFTADWYFESEEILDTVDVFPEPQRAGDVPIQTLPSGPSYPTENYLLMALGALHAARRRVIITTPYFVPDDSLIQAMRLAVLRGVKVELIVPKQSDKRLLDAVAGSFYDELLEAGVNIHRYRPGLLHSKTLTVDDEIGLFGTSNFDIRSFAINFELSLILYGREVTTQLRVQQERYIAASRQLTQSQWNERSTPRRVLEGIARLVSPLL
jgi:cardiolipin synthase